MSDDKPAQTEAEERTGRRVNDILRQAQVKGLDFDHLTEPAFGILDSAKRFGETVADAAWKDGKAYDGERKPPGKTVQDVADSVANGVRQSIIDGAKGEPE